MPTETYVDEDVDTDDEVSDEVDDDEVDDEEDADDELSDEGESTSELEAASEMPEVNAITELRKKSKQETLFRDALATLNISNEMKAESVSFLSFPQFLNIMPQLESIIKMAYLNWMAVKKAKQWSDVNSEVLADVDALLVAFHFNIDSKFVDWAIHSVLQLLQLTVPITSLQNVIGAASVVQSEDVEERDLEVPEIIAMAEKHNLKVLPMKVYKRLKATQNGKPETTKLTAAPTTKKKKKKGR